MNFNNRTDLGPTRPRPPPPRPATGPPTGGRPTDFPRPPPGAAGASDASKRAPPFLLPTRSHCRRSCSCCPPPSRPPRRRGSLLSPLGGQQHGHGGAGPRSPQSQERAPSLCVWGSGVWCVPSSAQRPRTHTHTQVVVPRQICPTTSQSNPSHLAPSRHVPPPPNPWACGPRRPVSPEAAPARAGAGPPQRSPRARRNAGGSGRRLSVISVARGWK